MPGLDTYWYVALGPNSSALDLFDLNHWNIESEGLKREVTISFTPPAQNRRQDCLSTEPKPFDRNEMCIQIRLFGYLPFKSIVLMREFRELAHGFYECVCSVFILLSLSLRVSRFDN